MGYVLGLDIGTTYTAAAVARGDGRPEVVQLGVRAAAVPSVVFLHEATVLTGDAALRRGLGEPDRLAREFKRRVGDPAPILLGGVPLSAETLFARLLRWAVDVVAEREGAAAGRVAVCHPANWGPYKLELLEQACRIAELEGVTTVTEPEAAAIQYAALERVEPGALVAVYDLGGGTFDAAVLRKTEAGFGILGMPEGIERLGGIDFDEAVVAHVRAAIGDSLAELDLEEPGTVVALARLRQECVEAKEALSADVEASIPVVLPGLQTEVRLTRAEFESMIRVPLLETIAALRRALRAASVEPEELTAVLLVGGSSRIPMVAEMVGAELGRPVAVDADPKYVVALGAARVAAALPEAAPLFMAPLPAPPAETAVQEQSEALTVAETVTVAETASADLTDTAASDTIASTPAEETPVEETAAAMAPVQPAERAPAAPAPPPAKPRPREPKLPRSRRRLALAAGAVVVAAVAVVAAIVIAGGNGEAPEAGAPPAEPAQPAEAPAAPPAPAAPETGGGATPGSEPAPTPPRAPGLELEWARVQDADLTGPGTQQILRIVAGPGETLVAVGSDGTAGERDAAFWTLGDLAGGASVEKQVSVEAGEQVPFGVTATGAEGFVAVGYRQPDPGSPDLDAAVWLSSGGPWELSAADFDDPPYQVMNRAATNAAGDILAVGAIGPGARSDGTPLQTDAAAWLSTDAGASFDRLEEATVPRDAYQVMRSATAYGNGWVVVGEDGSNGAVWRSENGAWRQIEGSPDLAAGERWAELDLRDVRAWRDGLVAVGFVTAADGDRDAGVWTSEDGESWRLVAHEAFGGPGDQHALGVVAGDFGIVAVGCSRCDSDDAEPLVWISVDGEAWTSQAGDELPGAGTARQLSAVTLAGTTLVAVGWEGAGADRDAVVWLAPLPATS